jgi:hypothetical protein
MPQEESKAVKERCCSRRIGVSQAFGVQIMRSIIIATGFLIATAVPGLAAGSWCARTSSNGYNGDCSFASYRQCRATISGQGGDCIRNPRGAYGQISQRHPRTWSPNNAEGVGNNGNSFSGSNSLNNGNNFGSFR